MSEVSPLARETAVRLAATMEPYTGYIDARVIQDAIDASLPPALVWTDTAPTVPGWYWWRGRAGLKAFPVDHGGANDGRKLGQWAGPITPPQEATP